MTDLKTLLPTVEVSFRSIYGKETEGRLRIAQVISG